MGKPRYLHTKYTKNYFFSFVPCIFILVSLLPKIELNCLIDFPFLRNEVRLLSPSDTWEMKTFIYYPNYTSCYTQLVSRTANKSIAYYPSAVGREYSFYVHLKDMYCTPSKGIANNDNLILTNDLGLMAGFPKIFSNETFEHIVFLYSSWGDVFGHWLQDCMPALLFIPQEIINKSMIMVSINLPTAKQWLEPFGINESRILSDTRYWYYTQNLYLYYQIEKFHGSTIYSMQKLINVLRDKFKVNDIKGTKYVLSNKRKEEYRSFSNFEDLFKETCKTFPKYPWEMEEWDYSNVSKLALQVAEIKVLISPSGSKTYYDIFMNHDLSCGILLLMAGSIDFPCFGLGITLDIWQIGMTNGDVWHWAKWIPCNITNALINTKRILYAVEHHKWPEGTFNDLREAFNLTKIRNITDVHPDYIIGFHGVHETYDYVRGPDINFSANFE